MKRINLLFLAITFFISGNTLYAQGKLRFGLQSGIVFSKVSMITKSNDKGELSYAYPPRTLNYNITNASNFYVNYTMIPTLSIALEPGYTQKSNERNGLLTYIQLPILLEYNVIDKLRLTAGPELNFLLNNDETRSYKELDTAVQLGAYYGVSYSFDVGLKFSRSFDKLLKYDIVSSGEDINFHQFYFQFFTRYRF